MNLPKKLYFAWYFISLYPKHTSILLLLLPHINLNHSIPPHSQQNAIRQRFLPSRQLNTGMIAHTLHTPTNKTQHLGVVVERILTVGGNGNEITERVVLDDYFESDCEFSFGVFYLFVLYLWVATQILSQNALICKQKYLEQNSGHFLRFVRVSLPLLVLISNP